MELFTQPVNIDPKELANANTTQAKNHQDNGYSLLRGTQPYLPHSPLTDYSVTTDKSQPRPCVDTGYAALLASAVDLPEVCIRGPNDKLYGVYQY